MSLLRGLDRIPCFPQKLPPLWDPGIFVFELPTIWDEEWDPDRGLPGHMRCGPDMSLWVTPLQPPRSPSSSFHYLLFQSVWPFLINIHKKRPIFLALCLLFSPPFSSSSGLLLLWSGRILDTVFSGVDSTIGVEWRFWYYFMFCFLFNLSYCTQASLYVTVISS